MPLTSKCPDILPDFFSARSLRCAREEDRGVMSEREFRDRINKKDNEMRPGIVVWCKEAENMHKDPDKKIIRVIPPCVRDWHTEPPCNKELCEAIQNYLKDYVK